MLRLTRLDLTSPLYAPACICSAMCMVALSDNYVKAVEAHMGLGQFQAIRAVAALAVITLIAWAGGQLARFRPGAPGALAWRTVFNVSALCLYFAALPVVPIAQAAAGMFTSPIWVALFSAAFFGERVGPRRLLGAALGFAGVVLVLEIGEKPFQPIALLAVVGGMSYALSVIWTRRYLTGETATSIAFWNFVGYGVAGVGILAAGPMLAGAFDGAMPAELDFMTRGWEPPSLTGIAIASAIGVTAILSSALLAEGYKSTDASRAALFDFSFLLWATLFAWALWGETVSWRQIGGLVLIVAAGALAVWSGARSRAAHDQGATRSDKL